jgi:phosphopantetheinyl transferase
MIRIAMWQDGPAIPQLRRDEAHVWHVSLDTSDAVVAALGLALRAIAQREIGVDVERIRPELADPRIGDRYFTPAEVLALRAVPETARPRRFLMLWTRKEAVLTCWKWTPPCGDVADRLETAWTVR